MSPKHLIRVVLLCALCVSAGVNAQTAAPASPSAPPSASVSGPVRNVVLVHGAFVDGSSWNRVIDLLQKKGYHVSAVQNPLSSLADDVAATKRVLARQDGPTILVGHSWGGTVITEAGADAPNVVGLVYITAIAPDVGESTMDMFKHGPSAPAGESIKPDETGFLWFDPAKYHRDFAADVPETQTRILAAAEQPVSGKAFGEPVTQAAWKSKPSWYMVTMKDRAVAPEAQRWMAKRIGATIVSVPSSHLAPMSHPAEVAALIEQAAKAQSK
ncbi:alpha/beta fold hydrolase [Paraburkholderia sp. GAS42]|jgi:pimeloyl-ACP methyl ester carboxylesterase|uniref:alpha/beta fold hydrolase n=1 Tax=Paraburkholderia sp. GAS42 TaxID=3035135 RepID=UPI003D1C941C